MHAPAHHAHMLAARPLACSSVLEVCSALCIAGSLPARLVVRLPAQPVRQARLPLCCQRTVSPYLPCGSALACAPVAAPPSCNWMPWHAHGNPWRPRCARSEPPACSRPSMPIPARACVLVCMLCMPNHTSLRVSACLGAHGICSPELAMPIYACPAAPAVPRACMPHAPRARALQPTASTRPSWPCPCLDQGPGPPTSTHPPHRCAA